MKKHSRKPPLSSALSPTRAQSPANTSADKEAPAKACAKGPANSKTSAKASASAIRRGKERNADAFFKMIMEVPRMRRSFYEAFLDPALVAALDWETLVPCGTEFMGASGKARRADVMHRVSFLDRRLGDVIFVLEHQSQAELGMPVRIVVYGGHKVQELIRAGGKGPLPMVMGIVVHQGRRPWHLPTRSLGEMPEWVHGLRNPDGSPLFMDFAFTLIDLPRITYEKLMGEHLIYAALAVMKFVDDPRPLESIDLLLEILAKHLGRLDFRALLEDFTHYLFSNAERLDSGDVLLQKLEAFSNPTIKTTQMTWAETLRQEGRQEGEEQGIHKGRQEGRREEREALLRRQLERKFGLLPARVLEQLEGASNEELEEISYALLDATSLDEVFVSVVQE